MYISVFFDKYVKSPTRYASVGGLYLSIMPQRLADQRKLENITLLSLLPGDVAFADVWELYREEIKSLEVTFSTFIIFPRLFKATFSSFSHF